MPYNPSTGVFTRVANSFSNPVFGTLIDPTDADALFDDYDLGLTLSRTPTITPQGRLTLVSGVPVMTTSQAGATTVYYTPYGGNTVPLYDGTVMVPFALAELSIALGSNWAANSNFDVFVGDDAGTKRLFTGPAWTSSTGRGTGAGTTELVVVDGLSLNAVSMTARYTNAATFTCAAQRGTYVGTIRTGSSTGIVNYQFGAVAAGCTAADFGVWNAYCRVSVGTFLGDTANSWAYTPASAGTWRAANNSATARVSAVRGADEDSIDAVYSAIGAVAGAALGGAGIGLNSTTAFSGSTGVLLTANTLQISGKFSGLMGLGYNFVSAIEYNSSNADAVTFNGDGNAPAFIQSGMNATLRM